MTNVYEKCPIFENDTYLLRLTQEEDAKDLLEVYSDKNALPFFNSDNCHGDNFYYPTRERMQEAVAFWITAYEKRWFVRLTIIEKAANKAIGTMELFHRDAEDAFDGVGVLRLDVGSDYEKEEILQEMIALVLPSAFELFYCEEIITKAPIYAVERINAIKKLGFSKADRLMIGAADGYAYDGYWVLKKS